MAGPAGAYGPMQQSPGQPIPGQLPPAGMAGMSMRKPGTITGIQVILWIFLAISAVANLFSVMSMVEFFNPFSLIGLAFAVYSAIQSLASGVHISRGKRWAWIWSLVSAILGLTLSLTGFVYGVIMFDSGGDLMLTIAAALTVLYGTLLGLLCSKSARQWILMHRIQRGEVQVPGTAGGVGGTGNMNGMAQMGGMVQGGAAEPQRPETRPGIATAAGVAMLLLAAVSAWGIYAIAKSATDQLAYIRSSDFDYGDTTFMQIMTRGSLSSIQIIPLIVFAVLLVCAFITAPLLWKGSAGARIFGLIWGFGAILAAGFLSWALYDNYMIWGEYYSLPGQPNPFVMAITRHVAFSVLVLVVVVLLFTPGVRAWTPVKSAGPIIMMVPMGQMQGQQPGPYGQPQQQFNQYQPPQQQQPPYPPQY
jgi:hypothetical protein